MKARIAQNKHSPNHVAISYAGWAGERVQFEVFCPIGGGPVRFWYGERGLGNQVCERLSTTGHTLACGKGERLVDVVRREYRAMRRAERTAREREERT